MQRNPGCWGQNAVGFLEWPRGSFGRSRFVWASVPAHTWAQLLKIAQLCSLHVPAWKGHRLFLIPSEPDLGVGGQVGTASKARFSPGALSQFAHWGRNQSHHSDVVLPAMKEWVSNTQHWAVCISLKIWGGCSQRKMGESSEQRRPVPPCPRQREEASP